MAQGRGSRGVIERTEDHHRRLSADAWTIALIVVLTIAVTWHLAYFDAWIEQQDITNQFLPWFAYLGKRLAAGEIPGWNPYQSSGAPFAGDPQSGWMYLPAMLLFPFVAPVAAFKTLIGVELLISGLGTFAFARVMRLGVLASLAAAFIFEFNTFSNAPAYCCTNRIQTSTWVPMMLLGVELALRTTSWHRRIMPWCLSGFALSQIYAGWLGQGMVYALLLMTAFLAYRTLLADPAERGPLRTRLVAGAACGLGSLAVSVGIGAAGLLPRYVVSRETLIGQGNYEKLPGSLIPSPSVRHLLMNIIGSDNAPRGVALGGVALALIWFAPALAPRAYGAAFFAAVTLCEYLLMLRGSPVHYLLYLIPRFHTIHAHNTINVSAFGPIGPAMLVGGAVEILPRWRPRRSRALLAALPMIAIAVGLLALSPHRIIDAGVVQAGALVTTVVVFAMLLGTGATARWGQIGLVAIAFIVPTGVQVGSAWAGDPAATPWQPMSQFNRRIMKTISVITSTSAPNLAGGYLQDELADGGPFRFSGYTVIMSPATTEPMNYTTNRRNPYVLAILTNTRAMTLELNDVSAYNPSQLARYARFINSLNGEAQNYHTTYIKAGGFSNKLFALLDVRYVLVDRRLTSTNSDVAKVIAGRHPVFVDPWVTVYESDAPVSPAWIVHAVKRIPKGSVLAGMKAAAFDPRTMAIAEGGAFSIKPKPPGAVDSAKVVSYGPERIAIDADAASDGLLVISEPYEADWKAYVDGQPVQIRATDYAFRGVPLTKGRHTVVLKYEPASLTWGIWISVASGLIVAALVLWRVVSWAVRAAQSSDQTAPLG